MKLKKRMLVAILLIVTIVFSGCNTPAPGPTPEAETKYGVTEQLIVSLQGTNFTAPKNIIYMIGDGMGANIIQATQEKYASE